MIGQEAQAAAPHVYAKTKRSGTTPSIHRWAARIGSVSIAHGAHGSVRPSVTHAYALRHPRPLMCATHLNSTHKTRQLHGCTPLPMYHACMQLLPHAPSPPGRTGTLGQTTTTPVFAARARSWSIDLSRSTRRAASIAQVSAGSALVNGKKRVIHAT